MQESELHSALKSYYNVPGAAQEVLVDGYWIDVVQGDLLIEIQIGNFAAIRNKLSALIDRHPVRLVHPIAQTRWIVQLPANGETPLYRRKSPRRGLLEHVFIELVRIPDLIRHTNFSLEVVLIHEEEVRRRDGKGSWRRNGVSIINRRLLKIVERHLFTSPSDLHIFLPRDIEMPFTNRQLAEKLAISYSLAAKMSYCLRAASVLDVVGRKERSLLYNLASPI